MGRVVSDKTLNFCKSNDYEIIKEYNIKQHNNKKRKFFVFKCKNNHKWKNRADRLKKCIICNKKEYLFDYYKIFNLKEFARNKSGVCLSGVYRGVDCKYKWKCKAEHIWVTKWQHVRNGSWCDKCRAYSLKDLKNFAKDKGGKCLSENYKNSLTKYKWECKNNHIFYKRWYEVHNGSWCCICNNNLGKTEYMVRKCFEAIFEREFCRVRPAWLRNPKTNRPLELDGYNEELRIAFEYQGIHHYKNISLFKSNSLSYIKYKDDIKIKKCKENGVVLFVVDCVSFSCINNVKKNIIKSFNKIDYRISDDMLKRLDDITTQYKPKNPLHRNF